MAISQFLPPAALLSAQAAAFHPEGLFDEPASIRCCLRGNASAIVAIACGILACSFARATLAAKTLPPNLRPPAVPLVTSDPYLSIWSEADRLTDDVTRHWTHHEHSLVSLIRVDGKPFRLMGDEPKGVPALPQTRLQVLPTRSIYDFDDGHVHVTLTFMTPALPHDLDVLTRPLTYITWQVRSLDHRRAHRVDLRQRQLAIGGQFAGSKSRMGRANPHGRS